MYQTVERITGAADGCLSTVAAATMMRNVRNGSVRLIDMPYMILVQPSPTMPVMDPTGTPMRAKSAAMGLLLAAPTALQHSALPVKEL